MKAALRERIVERLLYIPPLIDEYMQQQASFVANTLRWFKHTEQAIEASRSPLVSLLSSLRGQLVAIDDGLLNPNIESNRRSPRKNKRALAAHLIQLADEALRAELDKLDEHFSELRDKLSQLIAIVSSNEPLPYSPVMSAEYLEKVWRILQANEATQSMSLYIKTRTDKVDRHYLMQELLTNLFQGMEYAKK